MLNKRLEKTEGAIMNGQHRETGNSEHTRHKKKTKKQQQQKTKQKTTHTTQKTKTINTRTYNLTTNEFDCNSIF